MPVPQSSVELGFCLLVLYPAIRDKRLSETKLHLLDKGQFQLKLLYFSLRFYLRLEDKNTANKGKKEIQKADQESNPEDIEQFSSF